MNRALLSLVATLVALAPIAASAPQPVCQPDCRVEQNSFAYMPAVIVVPDGGSIVFASLDTGHVTVGGSGFRGDWGCFFVEGPQGADAPPVKFLVQGGFLFASVAGGPPQLCTDAVSAPSGFVLPFHCFIHPPMRGAILVTTA